MFPDIFGEFGQFFFAETSRDEDPAFRGRDREGTGIVFSAFVTLSERAEREKQSEAQKGVERDETAFHGYRPPSKQKDCFLIKTVLTIAGFYAVTAGNVNRARARARYFMQTTPFMQTTAGGIDDSKRAQPYVFHIFKICKLNIYIYIPSHKKIQKLANKLISTNLNISQ